MKSPLNLILVVTLIGLCSATCYAGTDDLTDAKASAYINPNTIGVTGSSSFSYYLPTLQTSIDGIHISVLPRDGTFIVSGNVSGPIKNSGTSTVSGLVTYGLSTTAYAKTLRAKAVASMSLGSSGTIVATANGADGYDSKVGSDNVIINNLPAGQSLLPESGMFSLQVKEP